MKLNYLIKYQSFKSIKEMDDNVQNHINSNKCLTASTIKTLYCIAKHSLSYYGACHLKSETIAREIGFSERTVYRATKVLHEKGIIQKHKTTKSTGNGATIFVIAPYIMTSNVSHSMSVTCQSLETHVSTTAPTVTHVKNETVTSFSTSSFNPSYVNTCNTYNAGDNYGIGLVIKEITGHLESHVQDELCKVGLGSIKKYMGIYDIPFEVMERIVINCTHSLIKKSGVKNVFAMYSSMIKRQVEQSQKSHERVNEKSNSLIKRSKELLPDWFEKRNEIKQEDNSGIDFALAQKQFLERLGN